MSRRADPILDGGAALEATLDAQHEAYRRLHNAIGARREALRRADADGMRAAVDVERGLILRIAELDRTRTEQAGLLGKRLGVPAGASVSVLTAQLRRAAEAPARLDLATRLDFSAARLRTELEQCRRESSVVRAAADAVAHHLAGVMQSVQSVFGPVKTYGRAGRLATATPIRSIDLTT